MAPATTTGAVDVATINPVATPKSKAATSTPSERDGP
jgi:hypothetical protein